jgi:hypothetical protein
MGARPAGWLGSGAGRRFGMHELPNEPDLTIDKSAETKPSLRAAKLPNEPDCWIRP